MEQESAWENLMWFLVVKLSGVLSGFCEIFCADAQNLRSAFFSFLTIFVPAESSDDAVKSDVFHILVLIIFNNPRGESRLKNRIDSDQRGTWFESHSLHYTNLSHTI